MGVFSKSGHGTQFTAVLVLLLLATVQAAAGQDGIGMLRQALESDSLLVFHTDTVLTGQQPDGNETIVFINCNGAVDRPVNGSVVILNGELGLRRQARVQGNVILVRATLFSSRGAKIDGESVSLASSEAVREINSTVEGRRSSGGSIPIHLDMRTNRMGGFGVAGYDRVDGFSVSWGFQLVQPEWEDFQVFSAKVISSTSRQAVGFDSRLTIPLEDEKRWQAFAGARSLTDTHDRWRLGDLENAIKAFVAGYDHRYYFRREGYYAGLRKLFGRRSDISLAYHSERYGSLVNQSPFTLVGEENFEPNLPVDGGPLHSVILQGQIDTRNDLFFTISGTRLAFEGEIAGGALGGEHGFARYDLSLERWDTFLLKHHTYLWFKLAGGDVSLPFQRGYTMGNALRGHDNFAYSGDRMILLQAAYGYTLPTVPVVEYLFFRWQADLIYEAGTAFYHDDPSQGYGDLKRDLGVGFTGNTILGGVGIHLFQNLDKSFHSGRRLTLTLNMNVNN